MATSIAGSQNNATACNISDIDDTSKTVFKTCDVVLLDYNDIVADKTNSENIMSKLEEAIGSSPSPSSSSSCSPVGIIGIRNVPGFVQAKNELLPMACKLVNLPKESLDKLESEETLYNSGWSYGKEKFTNSKPDYSKGSFYFNPTNDTPGNEEERKKYPMSYPCNMWPDETDIPRFKEVAKNMGCLMKDAVVLLSRYIDSYAKSRMRKGIYYEDNTLYNALKDTEKVKGRLLYYFPMENKQDKSGEQHQQQWIGWHNDSGFLTALAGDIYVNHKTGEILDESQIDTSEVGLFVVGRDGEVIKVNMPYDCMAIQIGECTQILTGGAVAATPHCVRSGCKPKGGDSSLSIARISLPCFIDASPTYPLSMPETCNVDATYDAIRKSSQQPETNRRKEVLKAGVGLSKVPPLGLRWTTNGMIFDTFLTNTFNLYYKWTGDTTKSSV